MDYLKNIFRQEERTSKKKLFKINKSSKATVSMTRSMFEADSVFYNEEPEIDSSS
jgi:predicted transcriptional regulator